MSREYEKGGFPTTSGMWFHGDKEPEIIYPCCAVHIDNDRICEEIKRGALESTEIRETAKEIYEIICEIVNG